MVWQNVFYQGTSPLLIELPFTTLVDEFNVADVVGLLLWQRQGNRRIDISGSQRRQNRIDDLQLCLGFLARFSQRGEELGRLFTTDNGIGLLLSWQVWVTARLSTWVNSAAVGVCCFGAAELEAAVELEVDFSESLSPPQAVMVNVVAKDRATARAFFLMGA